MITVRFVSFAFILFLFTLFFPGCCKDCGCNCDKSGIKQNTDLLISDWYFHQEGSFWVYRLKQDTTVIDKVSLTSKSTYSEGSHCFGEPSCTEVHVVNYKHSNTIYFPGWIDSSNTSEFKVMGYYGNTIEFAGTYNTRELLQIPAKKNDENHNYRINDIYEEFELHGHTFENVFHLIRLDSRENSSLNVEEIIFNQKNGIICITSEGLTWELIDFNTIL
jgi:hypothetical protein